MGGICAITHTMDCNFILNVTHAPQDCWLPDVSGSCKLQWQAPGCVFFDFVRAEAQCEVPKCQLRLFRFGQQ